MRASQIVTMLLALLHVIMTNRAQASACTPPSIWPTGPLQLTLSEEVQFTCTVPCNSFSVVSWQNAYGGVISHRPGMIHLDRSECDAEASTQNYTLTLNVTRNTFPFIKNISCIGDHHCESPIVETLLQKKSSTPPTISLRHNKANSTIEVNCTTLCEDNYSVVGWHRGNTTVRITTITEPPDFRSRYRLSRIGKEECSTNPIQNATVVYLFEIDVSDETTTQILPSISCVADHTHFSEVVQLSDGEPFTAPDRSTKGTTKTPSTSDESSSTTDISAANNLLPNSYLLYLSFVCIAVLTTSKLSKCTS